MIVLRFTTLVFFFFSQVLCFAQEQADTPLTRRLDPTTGQSFYQAPSTGDSSPTEGPALASKNESEQRERVQLLTEIKKILNDKDDEAWRGLSNYIMNLSEARISAKDTPGYTELLLNPSFRFSKLEELMQELRSHGTTGIGIAKSADQSNYLRITASSYHDNVDLRGWEYLAWKFGLILQLKYVAGNPTGEDRILTIGSNRAVEHQDIPNQPSLQPASSRSDRSKEVIVRVFSLTNMSASFAYNYIQSLYGPDVAVAPGANSLTIRCSKDLADEIEVLLLRMDRKSESDAKTLSPNNVSQISDISQLRAEFDKAERVTVELAVERKKVLMKFDPTNPVVKALETKLRDAVSESFTIRQRLLRAEFEEFSKRLNNIRDRIDSQSDLSKEIIDRRVNELLSQEYLERLTKPQSK